MIPYWLYVYVIALMAATAFVAGYCMGKYAQMRKTAKEEANHDADDCRMRTH